MNAAETESGLLPAGHLLKLINFYRIIWNKIWITNKNEIELDILKFLITFLITF